MGEPSVVVDQGLYTSSCGYCKSDAKTSVSYGLWAHSLSVYDYQELLNRGWRRSGMFLYKPEMDKTCCPAYTIRLKVDSFCPSKEQNRVMHRMQRYLEGVYNGPVSATSEDLEVSVEGISSEADAGMFNGPEETLSCGMECDEIAKTTNSVGKCVERDHIAMALSAAVEDVIKSCCMLGPLPADLEVPRIVVQKVKPTVRKRIKTSTTGDVVYSCSIAFSVAATLSRHKDFSTVAKALQQGEDSLEKQKSSSSKVSPSLLAEQFAAMLQTKAELVDDYKVEPCDGHLNFLLLSKASAEVWNTEDMQPNKRVNDDRTCVTKLSSKFSGPSFLYRNLRPRRILEVRMIRSAFDPEEFALYKRYQIAVHHDKPDEVKESSYTRFLVNSPLKFVPPAKSSSAFCGFGSFHQQYLIDGRLIAVGVVDILPSCLSSKYLFWDPDLPFLSLGKYSALQEIQWVQNAHTVCPSLEYYYLGYYIHACPKMRYKGAYRPSELLCPIKFQWVPFEIAEPLLNVEPFVCLSDYFDETAKSMVRNLSVEDKGSALVKDCQANKDALKIVSKHKPDVAHLNGAASCSKESDGVSNVLLKLDNQFLQFKHLQAWTSVPQKFIDVLSLDLQKYLQVVGPILATKMAYVIG